MPEADRWAKIAGCLLVGLFGAVAFALACYEITDRDLWWQLRSGEWIVSHGRVPSLDPFSYGSADRAWIDLHWLFQIVLAGAHRLAGLPGVVLMAGTCAAASALVALSAAARSRLLAICIVCWLPALALIGWRLPPRPELFSLGFLAIYLAVLEFSGRRPKLLRSLPIVQVLWVNSHGLFILGPLVLGMAFVEQTASVLLRRRQTPGEIGQERVAGTEWRRTGLVLAVVVAACFVNPYVVRGALFPWQLLPKISEAYNVYKQSVGEFRSPSLAFRDYRGGIVPGGWYVGLEYLLLGLLPVSFVLPAVRRAGRAKGAATKGHRGEKPHSPVDWGLNWRLVVGSLAIAPPMASALTLPGPAKPAWLFTAGSFLPCAYLLLAVMGGWTLRKSRHAAAMAACGAVACAAWLLWLRYYFCGANGADSAVEPLQSIGALGLAFGAAAFVLALRHGASLYRILLAAAFGYLGLQAIRNAPLFGLVAGAVLAWNFGDYLDVEAWTRKRSDATVDRRIALAGRFALVGCLIFWLWAIVNDRYYDWLQHSRSFGFHEKPFWSAHDAAQFAGRPGMPNRAIAFGFEQAGVYLYHNGPERKPFLDPRLEIPDAEVYRTYVELVDGLAENASHWANRLHEIGDPLVLVAHVDNERREASLLVHPDWRCTYFDAVAAIFIRGGKAPAYPALNFADRRWRPAEPSVPALPGAAYREATALCRLAVELKRFPERTWEHRVPVLLAARERIEFALREESGAARVWALLGNCLAAKIDNESNATANGEWSSARDLPWAQAAFAYRRALEIAPGDPEALAGLYQLFAARRMIDAQTAAGVQLQKIGWASPNQTAEIERLQSAVESVGQTRSESPRAAAEDFFQLLGAGRALAALAVVEQNALSARDWSVAAPAARLYLFLGAPERARRLLESTSPSADETERQRLIADAYLAELRLDAAAAVYREVLARRSDLADVGDVTCRCRRCRWRAGGLPLGTQNLAERTGASGIAGLGAIVALGLYRFHTPDSSCPNISARESHAVARCELAAEFERQSSLVAPRNG